MYGQCEAHDIEIQLCKIGELLPTCKSSKDVAAVEGIVDLLLSSHEVRALPLASPGPAPRELPDRMLQGPRVFERISNLRVLAQPEAHLPPIRKVDPKR